MAAPTLIFAYGNPSRGDDALGPAFIERLAARAAAHPEWREIEFLTDFQLQVEHATDLEGRERVLFVDASVACAAPYEFSRLEARPDPSFTSHALHPAAVLEVFRRITGREPPPCFLLSIRGAEFELGAPLSAAAQSHLDAALAFAERLCAAPTAWSGSGSATGKPNCGSR